MNGYGLLMGSSTSLLLFHSWLVKNYSSALAITLLSTIINRTTIRRLQSRNNYLHCFYVLMQLASLFRIPVIVSDVGVFRFVVLQSAERHCWHRSELGPRLQASEDLTPSLPRPVKVPGWKCTDIPANSIFSGPITHLPSMLCVLIKILSHASVKKKTKRLMGFEFRTFNVCLFSSDVMAVKG